MAISEAERQLLIAAWDAKSRSPRCASEDDLRNAATELFEADAVDIAAAFGTLVDRGWLKCDQTNGIYMLAHQGAQLAPELLSEHRRTRFGFWMIDSEMSGAYAEFCRRVHGSTLIQFNMVDSEQWATLLHALKLERGNRVLDLGCGIGTVAEYISDHTGAHVTGIDFADQAIRRAAERCSGKRERLAFQVGDLNCLDLAAGGFDVALAFDTLYFVDDLTKVVGDILKLLVPGGQLAAFFTSIRREGDGASILESRSTRLAEALTAHRCSFHTWDFTENERRLWQAASYAADDLKSDFEAEGNMRLWKSRDKEAKELVRIYESGSARRYLYHVTMG